MSFRIQLAIVAVLAQSAPAVAAGAALGAASTRELVVPPPAKCLPAEVARGPAPTIVSSFPAEGQVVRPGLVIIRVTFDRPMTCGGFLGDIAGLADPCPSRRQAFIQSFDHRTIRTACLTQPGQAYGFVVGGLWSPPFVSLDGQRTPPLEVRFRTSDGPAVTSAGAALAEDVSARTGRQDAGQPVIDGRDLAIAVAVQRTVIVTAAARVAALEPQLRLTGALAGGRHRTACAVLAGQLELGSATQQAVAFTEKAAAASCR